MSQPDRKPSQIITSISLFTALMVAGAYIRVPLGPVPIVLTNLFTVAAGVILGPGGGAAAVGLYLVLGALGLPVFSQGGGAALLIGPTGGFFLGYLAAAVLGGFLVRRGKPSLLKDSLAVLAAFLLIYLPGLPWLRFSLELSWTKALLVGVLPFIPGDILKAAGLIFLLRRLRTALPEYFPRQAEK